MAKLVHTFNFTTSPSDTIVRVSELFGNRFSLLLGGTFGGATIAMLGGDGTIFEPLMITSLVGGTTHNAFVATFVGMFNFNACCTHLKFDLTGGAGIDIDLDLFSMMRPA